MQDTEVWLLTQVAKNLVTKEQWKERNTQRGQIL